MGDPSTHLIFYQAYWYLVYIEPFSYQDEPQKWVDTKTGETVCLVSQEEKSYKLENIK